MVSEGEGGVMGGGGVMGDDGGGGRVMGDDGGGGVMERGGSGEE